MKEVKMFFKKKQNKLLELESRIQQLECSHNYLFDSDNLGMWPGYQWVTYKCIKCGKTRGCYWRGLSKQEQQAAKVLKAVPNDWPIKGGK